MEKTLRNKEKKRIIDELNIIKKLVTGGCMCPLRFARVFGQDGGSRFKKDIEKIAKGLSD